MDEEIIETVVEDQKEDNIPLEVKILNHPKKEKTVFDIVEDEEYDDLRITKEQVEEFENGDSPG